MHCKFYKFHFREYFCKLKFWNDKHNKLDFKRHQYCQRGLVFGVFVFGFAIEASRDVSFVGLSLQDPKKAFSAQLSTGRFLGSGFETRCLKQTHYSENWKTNIWMLRCSENCPLSGP